MPKPDFTTATGRRYRCVVIGTGPAGTALALELTKTQPDADILLVEFGRDGETASNELDDTIVVETPVTHHSPDECTNKGFGGTSQTWGGRCVSYDDVDFVPRPAIGDTCTWDMSVFDDVKRYYATAGAFMHCGKADFSLKTILGSTFAPIAEGFKSGGFTDDVVERWSLPLRVAKHYAEEVAALPKIHLLEGAKATRIVPNGDSHQVEIVDRATGKSALVDADKVVLTAGAQETTRILLQSPEWSAANPASAQHVGLYYQGHISGKIASIVFTGDPRKTDYGFHVDEEGVYVRRRFQPSRELVEREGLLNTALWLDNPPYYDASHRSGAMSMIYIMIKLPVIGKKLAPPAIARSITKDQNPALGPHIVNILRGVPMSLLTPFIIAVRRYLPKRKLPGVFLYSRANTYALHFHAEQQPVAENRMWLEGGKLHIKYGYTDVDVQSVLRTHELLDQQLRSNNCGRLEFWYEGNERADAVREGSKDGIHQVGTTRMSTTPDRGVVDTDCKLWGTDNVYVCSSSVFPTSGQANPTFLLVAFAHRLAHHLAS